VRFDWRASAAPAPGQQYRLLVCAGAGCEPRYAISSDSPPVVWRPSDTRGNPDLAGGEGPYSWAVVLDGAAGVTARSAPSSFTWTGGTCGDEPRREPTAKPDVPAPGD
jgi:hypothetical protein